MVSRHHARIFWGGGGYVLEDLSSANGVYFQEQRVQSHLFKHGDAVRCGSLWLRFVDQGAATGAAPPAGGAAPGGAPMMQHPGMGVVGAGNQTGHVAAVNPAALAASLGLVPQPVAAPAMPPPQQQQAPAAPPAPVPSAAAAEAEVEIRVLRRRVEQLQTELRVYRSNKFNNDTARRMEDLEADLSAMEIERDTLKTKLTAADALALQEAGSIKVKRALEIAAMTAEAASSLNDLLSSLRIEVMSAEGEFEQYAHNIPRASFELIRQSLREAQGHCDAARDMLRKLREAAGG